MAFFGVSRSESDLEVLDGGILAEISDFASKGLSKEEILGCYSLVWEDLPVNDRKAFTERFNYGRAQGIKAMADALFTQARGKNGTAAALAFLMRFGKEYVELEGGEAVITIRDSTGKEVVPDARVKIS